MKLVILHLLVFHAVDPRDARTRGPGTAFNPPDILGQCFDSTPFFAKWGECKYVVRLRIFEVFRKLSVRSPTNHLRKSRST